MTIYEESLEIHGFEAQLDKLVEECAEFIVAREHFKQGRIKEKEMLEELVDVEVVLESVKVKYRWFFDNIQMTEWDYILSQKLEKLRKILPDKEIRSFHES